MSPKVKKNSAANVSRSGSTSLRTRGATVRLGDDQAGHERADGVGHVHLFGDAGDEHGEADEAHGEQLVLLGTDDRARRATRRSGR